MSSSPTFTSGAEGQVIALAERGLSEKELIYFKDWSLRGFYLEDLADLGVEVVEELREGEAGSRAEQVNGKKPKSRERNIDIIMIILVVLKKNSFQV